MTASTHTLRTLCLALAGAGLLLPALAQDAAEARRALGLDAAASAAEPLPERALGLEADADIASPVAAAGPQDDAPRADEATRTLPGAVDEPAALALGPDELAPARPARDLPLLAAVPDAPPPAPYQRDPREAPLLAETRMTQAPLLAAVPLIDGPPDAGDAPPDANALAQAELAERLAEAALPVEPTMAFAPLLAAVPFIDTVPFAQVNVAEEEEAAPPPGHALAAAQALGPAGAVEFAALDDTRVLAAAEAPAARIETSSPEAERVLDTLADVVGLRDVQPLLHEPVRVATAPLSAVDRVLADLAEVTERWALAQEAWLDELRPNTMGEGWQRMARVELDGQRGGFFTPNGLRISFGIERAVYINGNLVATTRLTVSELGAMSGTGAAVSGNLGALIQNGALGTVTGTIAPGSVGTVIQNALNGQQIQNTTVINATVNSLDVMRSMNLQSTIRNAVSDSLRR